jgi:hypothetical protein
MANLDVTIRRVACEVCSATWSIEESSDLIGNRTRDHPACSIVSRPTTLSRGCKRRAILNLNHSFVAPLCNDHLYQRSILSAWPRATCLAGEFLNSVLCD